MTEQEAFHQTRDLIKASPARLIHAAQMIRIEANLLQDEAPGASPLKQAGRNILIAINDALKAHVKWEEDEEIARLLG